jgi:hypothetical protein
MSLCPSTVSSGGLLPEDFYFALKSDIAPPQVLSQNANTVSLSGGGGAVNIASTSAVALSTQKLTAVTYDTGLLETNVAGILNVGLGSAIGSTRVEGAKIVIQRDLADPQIEFVKGVNVERIKYDGTKLLMGPVGIDGEIYDNFGSPGAAGQQLQSSGPGLPFVWGAGSGVGLTAVVAGSNIGVDNTNPIAPIVNVAISSTLDMLGQEITNALDVTIKGTNPSVDFENSTGVQKAALDYVELTDKITLTGTNVVMESTGTGAPRVILDTTYGTGVEVRADNLPVRVRRYSAGGTTVNNEIDLAGSGISMAIGGATQVSMGGAGNIGVGGSGSDGSVFLVKNDNTVYGALNYNGGNDTLNVDNGGSGISVGASGITMTASNSVNIDAPTLIQYTQNDVNSVVIESLSSVPTNTIAAPSLYYEKFGGIPIDNVNPPSSPIFVTPQFFWRYSGALSPTGLNLSSGYCNSQRVEVTTTVVMTGNFNDQILLGVVLVDLTVPTTYYSENAFSFDDVNPATDRAYAVAPVRVNLTGERNWSATFTTFFDAINIIDGSPCEIRIYGLLNNPGPQTLSEIRATNRIRPVRLWDV